MEISEIPYKPLYVAKAPSTTNVREFLISLFGNGTDRSHMCPRTFFDEKCIVQQCHEARRSLKRFIG